MGNLLFAHRRQELKQNVSLLFKTTDFILNRSFLNASSRIKTRNKQAMHIERANLDCTAARVSLLITFFKISNNDGWRWVKCAHHFSTEFLRALRNDTKTTPKFPESKLAFLFFWKLSQNWNPDFLNAVNA